MKPLNNYLATHRQRTGLSQGELGQLLGHESRATVSLLERGWVPSILRTLLHFEVLFGVPTSELFPGERLVVIDALRRRARRLEQALSIAQDTTARSRRKVDFMQSISI